MKALDKKEILDVVKIQGRTPLRAVAVQTAKDTVTAYLGVTHTVKELPEKPNKEDRAHYDNQEHNLNVAVANRGSILEKEAAFGFFPKLSKKKYAKKALSDIQK